MCQKSSVSFADRSNRVRTEEFDERERMLRHHLTLLREDVSWCSRATDEILLCHVEFANLTAQRIEDASGSWLIELSRSQDTTRLANKINKASSELSEQVTKMQGNLKSFVIALEKMKGQSTARWVLGWLKYLLKAIASIFELGSFLYTFLHTVAPGVGKTAPIATTLWNAASAFRGASSGMFLSEFFYTAVVQFRHRNTHRGRNGDHRVRNTIPQRDRPEGSAGSTETSRTVQRSPLRHGTRRADDVW